MGGVLSYSGVSTKIRAMSSHLITDEQLQEIVHLPDVSQIAAYLKKTPEYARAWADLDENQLHRGQIEKLLKESVFRNFSRIYNFANKEQRKFLALYSKRYEIRALKEILTNLFDHRSTDPVDISPYHDFFLHHSKLNLERLAAAGNMDEFMNALKGNEFYAPLQGVYEAGNGLLFDYGMALDLYYFNQIWNVRKKLFKGIDLDQITKAYGEKFDMLNLQFISRSKRYYKMEPAAIYAQLIPVNYKLKREEITAMVEATTNEEGQQIFSRTWYGQKYKQQNLLSLEELYNSLLRSVLEKEAHKNPYSVAVLYSYLYHKEHEISRLTIALECVRYQVDPDEAMRYVHNN